MQMLLNVAIYKLRVHNRKNEIIYCRKVSFITGSHCQFVGVCQGMEQTWLYLPLSQIEWDRCDQQVHLCKHFEIRLQRGFTNFGINSTSTV